MRLLFSFRFLYFVLFLLDILKINLGTYEISSKFDNIPKIRSLYNFTSEFKQGYEACLSRYLNDSLKILCTAGKSSAYCTGPPDTRLAWLNQCIAKSMVDSGFQIPVYVVHGPDTFRLARIKAELSRAGFQHIHIHNRHQANSLNRSDVDSFFIETKGTYDVNDEAYKKCIEVFSATKLGAKDSAEVRCTHGKICIVYLYS